MVNFTWIFLRWISLPWRTFFEVMLVTLILYICAKCYHFHCSNGSPNSLLKRITESSLLDCISMGCFTKEVGTQRITEGNTNPQFGVWAFSLLKFVTRVHHHGDTGCVGIQRYQSVSTNGYKFVLEQGAFLLFTKMYRQNKKKNGFEEHVCNLKWGFRDRVRLGQSMLGNIFHRRKVVKQTMTKMTCHFG